MNFIHATSSPDALNADLGDRRYYVLDNHDQSSAQRIARHFREDFDLTDPVSAKQWITEMRALVRDQLTAAQQLLNDDILSASSASVEEYRSGVAARLDAQLNSVRAQLAGDVFITCSCPSGDGSLRWPCKIHPPEAQKDAVELRASAPAAIAAGYFKFRFGAQEWVQVPKEQSEGATILYHAAGWPAHEAPTQPPVPQQVPVAYHTRDKKMLAFAEFIKPDRTHDMVPLFYAPIAFTHVQISKRDAEQLESIGEKPVTENFTAREIMEEWDRHYIPGKKAGTAFLQIVVNFARHWIGQATDADAGQQDAKRLDFLEQHGTVRFSFETADIYFEVPEELEGSNSIRDLIDAAISMKGGAA